jgi:uncharacterized protein YfaS (alpha-2-macroglobulin family)
LVRPNRLIKLYTGENDLVNIPRMPFLLHYLFISLFLFQTFGLLSEPKSDKRITYSEAFYEDSWDKVKTFEGEGKPRSALNVLKALYERSKKENNSSIWIKTIIHQMKYMSSLEEEEFYSAFNLLRKEVKTTPTPTRQILYSILGEMYWNYYQGNRYKFMNRTEVADSKETDVRKWDLKTIVRYSSMCYKKSLEEDTTLKSIEIKSIEPILTFHKSQDYVRPTLYDFLIHRAIDFYSNQETTLTSPIEKFYISKNTISENSKFDYTLYHSEPKKFITSTISNMDESSFSYRAVNLLQKLLEFRMEEIKNNPTSINKSALIDADLKRHTIVHTLSIEPQKKSYFLQALERMKVDAESNPSSAEISFTMAKEFASEAYQYDPKHGNLYANSAKKAIDLCNMAILEHPKSFGGKNCNALITSLQEKSIQLQVVKTNLPNSPFPVLLTYKNISRANLWIHRFQEEDQKAIQTRFESVRNKSYIPYETIVFQYYADKKPFSTIQLNLNPPKDYNTHSSEVIFPPLPKGDFIVFATPEDSLIAPKIGIAFDTFVISEVAYINRIALGKMEFYLTNRSNGEPLSNVNVTQIQYAFDKTTNNYRETPYKKFKSDDRGYFSVPMVEKESMKFHLEVQYKDEIYIIGNPMDPVGNKLRGLFFQMEGTDKGKESKIIKTFFFTDRSIYRPGQKLFFKSIPIESLGDSNRILPNESITIQLLNVNRVIVSELKLKTNQFGSVHGSFVLPETGLTGKYTLRCITFKGDYSVSVEDYKRPKFKIELSPPKNEYRLKDNVTVKGFAKAYSGANIDNAKLKYTVKRQTNFPRWFSKFGILPPVSPEVLVNLGEMNTDTKGEFAVQFSAIPDESIPAETEPVFQYKLSVDITDSNGETVTQSLDISVGTVSLRTYTDLPENMDLESFKSISIETKNLSGQSISANGKIEIFKLQTPTISLNERVWVTPDTPLYSKEEWHTTLPLEPYGNELEKETWNRENKPFSTQFITGNGNVIQIPESIQWKSGVYLATIICKDSFGRDTKETKVFSLYSSKEKKLPMADSRFFHIHKKNLEVGDTLQVSVSNLHRGKALFEVEQNGNILRSEWLDPKNTPTEILNLEIPVVHSSRGNFGIHYTYIFNNRLFTKSETILVPRTDKELKISFQSFRNKVQPGTEEEWKLKVEGFKKDKLIAEMLATLYDASLDAFKINQFHFNIYSMYYASLNWGSTNGFSNSQGFFYNSHWNEPYSYTSKSYRSINYFGYRFTFNEPVVYNKMSRVMAEAPSMEMDITPSPKISKVERKEETSNEKIPIPNIRSDFRETAFFFPELQTDELGNLLLSFKLPDSLTTWKFLGFAHTKSLEYGFSQNELVAQKNLMVIPNPPRFLREGDTIAFTVKLKNLSNESLWGKIELELFDPNSMKNVSSLFLTSENKKKGEYETSFEIKEEGNTTVSWILKIPTGINSVLYRINATSGKYSDGEEMILPILTNRMMVTETLPLSVNGKGNYNFQFQNLLEAEESTTLRHHKLTLEYTSNPIWLAISALPYLAEYPYECLEQTFSRYYANSLALHLLKTNPEIEQVFTSWRSTNEKTNNSLLTNLEKNKDLKSILLEETPWVIEAKQESENKKRVALLFETKRAMDEMHRAFQKIQENQSIDGSWGWFNGMEGNRYITQYILGGLGHLKKMGITSNDKNNSLQKISESAIRFLDKQMKDDYESILASLKKDSSKDSEVHLPPILVHYLYVRSFYPEYKISIQNMPAYSFFLKQAKKYKFTTSFYSQGMIALTFYRSGDKKTANRILDSLKENAIQSKEMGTYWKSKWSYDWYEMPIETQSLLLETFHEIEGQSPFLSQMKVWLLRHKQTNQWSTTKSTTEAIYALLLGDSNLKKSTPPDISLGELKFTSNSTDLQIESGSGYFKTSILPKDISSSLGNIIIKSNSKGMSYGGIYWQYFENLDKIKPSKTPLKIDKKLFLQSTTNKGTTLVPLSPNSLKVGDLLKVRIEITVDRDMEFIHLKDMRASALEPTSVLSKVKFRDGLGYYESTRDGSTHFFFDKLPKGIHIFEYPLRVSQKGSFSNGITSIQSMYAPEFSSHSEGVRIKVE